MGKTIVICSDGTWNDPQQRDRGRYRPSNVVKMAAAIAPMAEYDRVETPQIVFYDPGIGTGENKLSSVISGATGRGLSQNVKDAYTFLINNYQPGDEVYFFGFSRGAYTVRSLAGMVGKCHLLKKEHRHLYHQAHALYANKRLRHDSRRVARFRTRYTQPCQIKFLGVWDTVGSLGLPFSGLKSWFLRKYRFHDVTLSPNIPFAYHAVAIDEMRGKFKPALWKSTNVNEAQTVEQVWFAGVHSNIGGGYADTGLADVAFTWMKDKAEGAGLVFDEKYIRENIRPNPMGRLRDSRRHIYRLLPTHLREIGTAENANESVHESAVARHEQMRRRYSPFNLTEAKERGVPNFPPVVQAGEEGAEQEAE